MTNPVTPTDRVFLKHFSMMIGLLVLVMFALIGLALYLYSYNPPPGNPQAQAQTEARVAPVGAVYAGDTGRAALVAAQDAAKKAAAGQVAYGGTLDGSVIFGNLCTGCHTSGAGGAPTLDKAHWAARLAQGKDVLHKHAIEGFTGNAGVMPPKGGNPALTDAQVIATVDWMLANIK